MVSWKLGGWLWLAGMPGVLAMAWLVTPQLLESQPLPVAPWVAVLAGAVQNALMLAAAVWIGCRLSPAVGVRAPVFEALTGPRGAAQELRRQLLPGIVGGVVGAIILVAAAAGSPAALAPLSEALSVPLPVRVLYGGVTEELLLRWGVMTLLAWSFWRLGPRRRAAPSRVVFWAAIVVSALLFGLGHLPVVAAVAGAVAADVAVHVVAVNTAFGVVAGVLFWRWGLEAAMLAHGLAHLVAAAVTGAGG